MGGRDNRPVSEPQQLAGAPSAGDDAGQPLLGLIDESAPQTAPGVHYVIGAAVLLDPGRREHARDQATKLLAGRSTVFHWNREGVQKREAMIELLGELEVGVFATIHTPVAATRQERARARSLRHMVEILDHEGVGELMIESRGPQDTHDRRVLLSATEDGLCSGDLSYSFETKAEPLMWLPDAIAGLLGEAECGRDPRWIAHLQHVAHIVDIRRLGP